MDTFTLRAPVVRCAGCSRFQYNAPKTETMCKACNLGLVSLSISPRLYVALLRRRLS